MELFLDSGFDKILRSIQAEGRKFVSYIKNVYLEKTIKVFLKLCAIDIVKEFDVCEFLICKALVFQY